MAAYVSFESALEATDTLDWSEHLAARIASDINDVPDEEAKQEIVRQVAYPLWLTTLDVHFSKATGDGSCLTINGLDEDGKPASVSVQYIAESGELKAEDFHYQLAESREQLPNEALCPSEIEPHLSLDSDLASGQRLPFICLVDS